MPKKIFLFAHQRVAELSYLLITKRKDICTYLFSLRITSNPEKTDRHWIITIFFFHKNTRTHKNVLFKLTFTMLSFFLMALQSQLASYVMGVDGYWSQEPSYIIIYNILNHRLKVCCHNKRKVFFTVKRLMVNSWR